MVPVADARSNQIARPGQTVQLHGSRSHDRDGTIAAYSWSYVGSIPAGLAASLSDPSAVKPTVFIDDAGTYIFQLVVADNAGTTSTPAQVRIRTGPVASAGPAQTVKVGQTVQLDGSKSFDPEGLPLKFHWTVLRPRGSQARLSDSLSAKPTVVFDVAGPYYIQLTVTDGAVRGDS
jgi:PKD domain